MNTQNLPNEANEWWQAAKNYIAQGDLEKAASALDKAYGLAPYHTELAHERAETLDKLAIIEHGIVFRYIPAGSFFMGSNTGQADERPVHEVELDGYWMSDTPISWAAYAELLGWSSPAESHPPKAEIQAIREAAIKKHNSSFSGALMSLSMENQIRLQYCEDHTLQASRDWHTHKPDDLWQTNHGNIVTSQQIYGDPLRSDKQRPWQYDQKPMVSVSYESANELCQKLSTKLQNITYRLPSETEWEKAARGGLVGMLYAWGNEPPDHSRCDFERFKHFSILPMRTFPPNGYGLYAMCGGVWEWTQDYYDALFYSDSPKNNPICSTIGNSKHVLRGGSWADNAEVVTVSFRAARTSGYWREGDQSEQFIDGGHRNPNIGFRICRVRSKP